MLKKLIKNKFVLISFLLLQILPGQASVIDACQLHSAWGNQDVCLIKENYGSDLVLGLHYGSLGTKALAIEVLRADGAVTTEKLELLKKIISLGIQSDSAGGSEERIAQLEGGVEEGKLIYKMERNLSSYYISEVHIKQVSQSRRLDQEIKEIFGPRAFAVIQGVPRE